MNHNISTKNINYDRQKAYGIFQEVDVSIITENCIYLCQCNQINVFKYTVISG